MSIPIVVAQMQDHHLHRSIHKYATLGENSSRAPQFSSLAADDKYNPANKQFVPEMRSIDIRWANFSTNFSMAIDNTKSIRKRKSFRFYGHLESGSLNGIWKICIRTGYMPCIERIAENKFSTKLHKYMPIANSV